MSVFNKSNSRKYAVKTKNSNKLIKSKKDKHRNRNSIFVKSRYSDEIFNDLNAFFIDGTKSYTGINKFDADNLNHINLMKKLVKSFLINKDRELIKYSKDFSNNVVKVYLKYYYKDLQDLKKIILSNLDYNNVENKNQFNLDFINKKKLIKLIDDLKMYFVNQSYYELDLQNLDKLRRFIKKQPDKIKFELDVEYVDHFYVKDDLDNNLDLNQVYSNQKSSLVYGLNKDDDDEIRWYISKAKILTNAFQFKQFLNNLNNTFPNEINYKDLFKSGVIEKFLRKFDNTCCVELMRYTEDKMPLVFARKILNLYGPLHIQNLYDKLSFQAINSRWILFNSNDLIENDYMLNSSEIKEKSLINLNDFVFQLFSAEELSKEEQDLMRNRLDTDIIEIKRGMEKDFIEVYQDNQIKKLVDDFDLFEI